MLVAFLFLILGLFIGSFLNVVILRLKSKKSFVKGRSKCPHCKKVLSWYELIPVFSFVFLLGKCSKCKKKISLVYPLVELACGVCFFLLSLQFGLTWVFAIYALLACFLVIIFVYDLLYYLILDKVVLPAAVIAILANFLIQKDWLDILWGVLIGGIFFGVQFILSKGKWVGGGDIRLGVLMGAMLGWQGLLFALLIAYLVGAIVAVGLIAGDKKKFSSKVPFGTFLSFATIVVLLYGDRIIDWYLNLTFYI